MITRPYKIKFEVSKVHLHVQFAMHSIRILREEIAPQNLTCKRTLSFIPVRQRNPTLFLASKRTPFFYKIDIFLKSFDESIFRFFRKNRHFNWPIFIDRLSNVSTNDGDASTSNVRSPTSVVVEMFTGFEVTKLGTCFSSSLALSGINYKNILTLRLHPSQVACTIKVLGS